MKKVLVLVEGQTEETFVRDVLNPHLLAHDVSIIPTLVVTKRVKDGPNFKGGVTSWSKVHVDLELLFRDTSATAITTMFDYYGLPLDFPGMQDRPLGTAQQRVGHVESAIAHELGEPRFVPYLSLHEFEALVFASLGQASWVFDDDTRTLSRLQNHLSGFATTEDINENPATAPSRRILDAFPRYQKVLHGPMAVEACGIATLRAACPHFDGWIARLEHL